VQTLMLLTTSTQLLGHFSRPERTFSSRWSSWPRKPHRN